VVERSIASLGADDDRGQCPPSSRKRTRLRWTLTVKATGGELRTHELTGKARRRLSAAWACLRWRIAD